MAKEKNNQPPQPITIDEAPLGLNNEEASCYVMGWNSCLEAMEQKDAYQVAEQHLKPMGKDAVLLRAERVDKNTVLVVFNVDGKENSQHVRG